MGNQLRSEKFVDNLKDNKSLKWEFVSEKKRRKEWKVESITC